MHWNSAAEFFAMGGYAFYVWGSFGVTALIMAVEPLLVARQRRQLLSRLKRQVAAENLAQRSEES
ncbi:MAG: heme exporter protein CcmD [Polyangiaceae bacterium]